VQLRSVQSEGEIAGS